MVRWDLRGKEPMVQHILSHPNIHLAFEQDNTRIWGVVTGRFSRKIEDKGKVFGIRFRPGAFYLFLGSDVASIQDTTLAFDEIFEEHLPALESKILNEEKDEAMVAQAETFLLRNMPEKDPNVEQTGRMVRKVRDDTSIIKVDDPADHFGISKRSIQRLFRRYVGIAPKWVIQRYPCIRLRREWPKAKQQTGRLWR